MWKANSVNTGVDGVMKRVGEVTANARKESWSVAVRVLGLSGMVMRELSTGVSFKSTDWQAKGLKLLRSVSHLSAVSVSSLEGLLSIFELHVNSDRRFIREWEQVRQCNSVGDVERVLGLSGEVLTDWRKWVVHGGTSVVRVSCSVEGAEVSVFDVELKSKAEFLLKWQERGEGLWQEVSKRQKLEELVGELSAAERKELLALLRNSKS